MIYLSLFIVFFKCGLLAFGGGSASVPLIETEVVDNLKILSESDFIEAYALGNTLPGPITTKLAAFVGYHSGGVLGLLICIVAYVLPSTLAMILLYSIYNRYKHFPWVVGMLKGVKPIICLLILKLLLKTTFDVFQLQSFDFRLFVSTIFIVLVGGILIFILEINPLIVFMVSMLLGGVLLV